MTVEVDHSGTALGNCAFDKAVCIGSYVAKSEPADVLASLEPFPIPERKALKAMKAGEDHYPAGDTANTPADEDTSIDGKTDAKKP